MFKMYVPVGVLTAPADDQAAAERRRALRDSLMRNETVSVTNSGEMKPASELSPADGPALQVPRGKLALDKLNG
jgi:hypothetical protein